VRNSSVKVADEIAQCYGDPYRFVLMAFEWGVGELEEHEGPDEWQTQVLCDVRDRILSVEDALRIAVASGHGVGKTALVAWIILWFMSTRVKCAGVVTAGTERQLTTKTWRELAVWHSRVINRSWFKWTATKFYHVDEPETWFISAIPWSESKPDAFAGLHARDVLIIYDEASTIHDVIWEVTEGALTTRGALWIAFGNPVRNTGRFRECFRRFAHRWICRHVDARTARMANRAQIKQWLEDYEEDSDFIRVRVTGQFPRAASNQFIPGDVVEKAQRRVGLWDGPSILAVDVARFGDDQTVYLLRTGGVLDWYLCRRGQDLMQTAGEAAQIIDRYHPDAVFIDGVGVGGGVVDRLRQLGYRVTDVNAGWAATDPMSYYNLRAEMWDKMRKWLKNRGSVPSRPADLFNQLTAVEYGYDRQNRIQLESKKDMKARGLDSPDIADALALTFVQPVAIRDVPVNSAQSQSAEPSDPLEDYR